MIRQLRICIATGTSGRPGCGVRGGRELLSAVCSQRTDRMTWRVSGVECLGGCSDGPNAVIEPDQIWYEELNAADAQGLIAHCENGQLYVGKLATRDQNQR
jgi:(2Fe-2S) ferredoxin